MLGAIRTVAESERKDKNLLSLTAILLQKNLHLILQHQEFIQSTPEYYLAELPLASVYIGLGPYSEDFIKLPMGALLRLWNEETLIMRCEKCSGKVHIFYWFGNTLRPQSDLGVGHYVYRGVCDKCGEDIKVFKNGDLFCSDAMKEFRCRAERAREVFNEYTGHEISNILRPGSPRRFSWGKGLAGGAVPVKEVIHPKVIPIQIDYLIKILHQDMACFS